MPSIGQRCHELRIVDKDTIWRMVYRTDADAIVIAKVFEKKAAKTPRWVIEASQARLRR